MASVLASKTKMTKRPAPYFRSLSASEYVLELCIVFGLLICYRIARNIGNFETWSTFQGCDQVSYSDIPKELKSDVDQVFDLVGKLPIAWTDKVLLSCSFSGDQYLNKFPPSGRAQRRTNFLNSLHPQSFWHLSTMLQNHAEACSLTELILKPVQNSLQKSLSYLLLGGDCETCVNLRRNGQKQTLLRTCMYYC
jgi:hypothetical protein